MGPGRSRRSLAPKSPIRSFALGGLVGAAGAFATVRRMRRTRTSQAAGLAAFEDAPCFVELLDDHAGETAEAGGER